MRLLSHGSLYAVSDLSDLSLSAINSSVNSAVNNSSSAIDHLGCGAINSLSSLLGGASAREERYTKNNSK